MSTRILLQVNHHSLKAARGELSASAVARWVGVTPQTFASYESGLNRVPANVLLKWCERLNLQPSTVIVDEDRRVLAQLVAAA